MYRSIKMFITLQITFFLGISVYDYLIDKALCNANNNLNDFDFTHNRKWKINVMNTVLRILYDNV